MKIIGTIGAQNCDGRLSDGERRILLDGHNTRRRELALGNSRAREGAPMQAAANMRKLEWDCSLEDTAQRHSQKCAFAHSDSGFRNSAGENLYQAYSSGAFNREKEMANAVKMWWDEINDMRVNNLFDQNGGGGKAIGHFTQMAWAVTGRLGCGYADCSGGKNIITCHYSPGGNFLTRAIYEPGQSCSKCSLYAGSHCSDNLCVAGKDYGGNGGNGGNSNQNGGGNTYQNDRGSSYQNGGGNRKWWKINF